MLVYAKSAFLDCLLCIIVSIALAFTACSGFYSTQPYQTVSGVAGMAGACAVLCVAMFAASANRTASIVGGIAIAVAVGALFAAAVATSSVAAPMDDEPGNNLYLAFCVLLPPIAAFALSRWRPTCVLLALGCVALCAVMEYLYWYGHVIAFAIAFAGSIALYAYRTYQASLLSSETQRLAFGPVTAAGAVLACVAVAAGIGLFTVAIAPLEPPNLVVKLITEHYRADEREVRGTATTGDSQSDDASSEAGDGIVQSGEQDEFDADVAFNADAAGGEGLDTQGEDGARGIGVLGAGLAGLTLNFPDWWPLVAASIAVALVIAVITARLLVRRRRFNALLRRGPDEAVRGLYLFFLSSFAKLKVPQPGTLTLQEYSQGFADVFRRFEQCAGEPAFAGLTQVYVSQVYGGAPAESDDLERFCDYYRAFHKRARAYIGRVRYCRMFFRI